MVLTVCVSPDLFVLGMISKNMAFFDKLKSKTQAVPKYTVTQSVELPIYELDLKNIIDPDTIKEKCLDEFNKSGSKNNRSDIVKDGWQSPYYRRGNNDDKFEVFNELITAVEDKLNSVNALTNSKTKLEVDHFWFVIYNKGTSHAWHKHLPKTQLHGFPNFSGVYYPVASDKAEPIEFKNDNKTLSISVTQHKLLLFPSMLYHRVPECNDSDLRISVAFNFTGFSRFSN
jgi:hypothetical protein